MCECTFLYKATILDLVTVEDWGEEILPEGVDVKLKKKMDQEGGGGEGNLTPHPTYPLHQSSTG